jgi:tetratricopeptide (TPR) repeat protein
MNGDYQVLKQHVEKERKAVHQARVSMASTLDQLGEHHVRQQEYDDAMDAFTEALREKRSVFSHISSPTSNADGNRSRHSSFSFSAVGGDGNSNIDAGERSETRDKAIDEIVNTLRNMGNVHSLRGEQDEAMRYYTEVTNLRAQKSSNMSNDPTSSGESKSLLAGLNDDTSTLMSEINEDVKALDDLFRSISFRNQGNNLADKAANNEKRKSKPAGPATKEDIPSNKRRKGDVQNNIVENEPFKRSTSSLCLPAVGNEVTEAMDMYKGVLEFYVGQRLEQQKELVNSLSLRAQLLDENRRKAMDPMTGEPHAENKSLSKAADLELALEVYNQILVAHEESNQARQQSQPSPPDPEQEEHAASDVASTLICMGSIYYKLGNRVKELRMYKEAKGVYQRAYGESHTFVAGTRKNIGMVLAERGEYEEAMQQFEKAMRIYLSVNDGSEMNRDVASAISCMGNVKNRVGELDAALAQYMEALRIYKTIHEGSADNEADALRDVTSTLKVIGMVHAKKGDLDTAMGFFQEAMALLRSPGIDSTSAGRETTASVLTRVASIHLKKGDLDQAMAHYREAYDLTVRNRGTTTHQEVAGILHYIGGIYHKRADYDEAMACYQEAIRIYHATLGPGNPTVAGTLVMVGSIYYKRRNLDSAMMFYREALRLNRDAYGMHHPDVAPILKSIGTILTKKGDYNEAYDIFRDVLSIKCTVHGTDHPEVASAYKSLGNVHYKLGDLADAERQYRHALSIYRRTKGEEHPDTVSAKTTIEHLRYWMREREHRQLEQRHAKSTTRGPSRGEGGEQSDERSC